MVTVGTDPNPYLESGRNLPLGKKCTIPMERFFFFFLLGPILTDNLWNLPAVMFFSCFNSDEELSCQS